MRYHYDVFHVFFFDFTPLSRAAGAAAGVAGNGGGAVAG